MGSVVILGGNAGGVHLVNLDSGDLVASPKMEDHEGPVTGLSAHMALRHFISCSSDGMIKVGDASYQCLLPSRLLPKCISFDATVMNICWHGTQMHLGSSLEFEPLLLMLTATES